jgi:hypothetical protein
VLPELVGGRKVQCGTVDRIGEPVFGGRGIVEVYPQQIAVGQLGVLADALALLLHFRCRRKPSQFSLQLFRYEPAVEQDGVFGEHKKQVARITRDAFRHA